MSKGAKLGIGIGAGVVVLLVVGGILFKVLNKTEQPNVVAVEQGNAPDNPFAAMERKREKETGVQFRGRGEPATAVFVKFQGDKKERTMKLLVSSHADKGVKQLDFVLTYFDASDARLSEQRLSHAPNRIILEAATTVEMDIKPVSIPATAAKVEAVVSKAVFADGTEWVRQ